MKKQWIMVVICLLAVCLFILPVQAEAAEVTASGTCGDGVTWTLEDTGLLTISGTGAMADYATASEVPWYSQRASVLAVTVADGVTTIGDRAFYNCTALTEVSVGSSVTTIGTYAFRGCSALEAVTIPESVTELKGSAFRACSKLAAVTVGGNAPTIGSYVFQDCADALVILYYEGSTGFDASSWTEYTCTAQHVGQWVVDKEPGCTTNGKRHIDCTYCNKTITETIPAGHIYVDHICSVCDEAEILYSGNCGNSVWWQVDARGKMTIYGSGEMFRKTNSVYVDWRNCRQKIKTVEIQDGVTSLCNYAFWGCTQLTEITMPDSLTVIGSEAFYNCKNLTAVTIPGSVKYIEYKAFGDCVALQDVTVENGVKTIGGAAFIGCTALTSIAIPDSVTLLETEAFTGCTNLHTVSLGNGLTKINTAAFSGCTALREINLPESLLELGMSAFSGCTSLRRVVLPEGITTIGTSVFSGCTALYSVTIPESLTELTANIFKNCTSLTEVMLPESLRLIATSAFENCTSLTSVTIPASVDTIHYDVFKGCTGLVCVTIPDITDVRAGMFYDCTNLKHVFYAGTQEQWDSNFAGSFNTEGYTLHVETAGAQLRWEDSGYTRQYYCTLCEQAVHTESLAESITMQTLPGTLAYFGKYGTLDVTGGEVLVHTTNGDTVTVPLTEDMVSGFDNTVAGTLTLTVTLEGKTTTYNVEITTATVEFRNADGTLLSSREYLYGDTVEIPADPEKPAGVEESFVFRGWGQTVGTCTGDAVYTAVFGPDRVLGDIDGNDAVTTDDVVQLLLHISMPDMFPIDAEADFDGNGSVTTDDAIKLLLHISMPDMFPLETRKREILSI